MRTEVHVHGNLRFLKGVSANQVESGLRPWLSYLDIDSVEEARSLEQEEPGIAYDTSARELTICWTGEVGRNFHRCVEESMQTLGPLTDETTVVELTYYHDDGQDESQLIFVGPTPEAIHEAQRRRMIEDVQYLLGRHFGKEATDRVTSVVNELFDQDWSDRERIGELQPSEHLPLGRNKHLH
jgi:hypothetical protein